MIDQWMANIRAHPRAGRGGQQAAARHGPLLHDRRHGDRARRARLGRRPRPRPAGPCTQAFPLHSTSRIVAGGPLRGGVYKCALQSVDARDRGRAVRVVDAIGGRGRAAEADLPDRGLRLHEGGCRPALIRRVAVIPRGAAVAMAAAAHRHPSPSLVRDLGYGRILSKVGLPGLEPRTDSDRSSPITIFASCSCSSVISSRSLQPLDRRAARDHRSRGREAHHEHLLQARPAGHVGPPSPRAGGAYVLAGVS